MKHAGAETPPLACVPGAIAAADRAAHFALVRELFERQALDKIEVQGGYRCRFPPASFEALSRFVSNERRCCPFLAFEITVEPADGVVWLKLTGPEGTRDFLDAQLGAQTTQACSRC
ncbi:MAG: hypothetical protein ACREVG_15260 [Burkholderiales bacterium]